MKAAALLLAIPVFLAVPAGAADEPSAIPAPVTAARFTELLERPPFRRFLTLPEALVLSGIARLPEGPMITVWNRRSRESYTVTGTPNPQGWKLIALSDGGDLKSAVAVISAGGQEITLRFDPERLTPPKLDNKSKPGARGESALVVEALLRVMDQSAARRFESLPAEAQESFRKAFTGFLATYPDADDEERLDFIRRSLAEARAPSAEEPAETPAAAESAAVSPSPFEEPVSPSASPDTE